MKYVARLRFGEGGCSIAAMRLARRSRGCLEKMAAGGRVWWGWGGVGSGWGLYTHGNTPITHTLTVSAPFYGQKKKEKKPQPAGWPSLSTDFAVSLPVPVVNCMETG